MPPPELFERNQKAVLWPAGGPDAYGQAALGEPEELAVRWRGSRSRGQDAQGNPVTFDATVTVAEEVATGSVLWEGSLAGWEARTGTDAPEGGFYEVKSVRSVPDIKGREIKRTLGLVRYRGGVPE